MAENPPPETSDYDYGLSIPPMDTNFLSQNDQNGAVLETLDFDFDFDFPSSEELEELLNPLQLQQFDSQLGNSDQFNNSFLNSGSSDLSQDPTFNDSSVLNSCFESNKCSDYIDTPSPESNGSNRENCSGGDGKVLVDCAGSPESQGSGNCRSNVSDSSNNCGVQSGFVDRDSTKLDEPVKMVKKNVLKRKKDCEELLNSSIESKSNSSNNGGGELSGEDEKKKARLIRNRESAQLSRQRKKHYVEELEDKVKSMHSTIQDLNAKISYFMTENMTLRQQMGVAPPPGMVAPPLPGMYPPAGVMYPWMHYPPPPPYMVKPQGSQVPLMPIPRLKPKQTAQVTKVSKKVESKKKDGGRTKKVAGVSFIGVLLFIMFFGMLVPMVNVRYGGVREALSGGEGYVGGGGYHEKHRGRVLMLNGTDYGEKYKGGSNSSVHLRNETEPLVASLYVPRNDKLVKIDGNLIISSVLASEKALSSHEKGGEETGLVPVHRQPHLRVGSADKDGGLHQWFREGLAGPMLSSGMCTEVFQFDISSTATSGAISSATTSAKNISGEQNKNSTHLTKRRNRRILRGIPLPLPESSHNVSRNNSQKENLKGNNSISPMVVSVLVDPRETGDADVDGVMGTKSLSRIFVVVLVDSVKYVTYSCMLPFLGSTPHLTA